MRRWLGYMLAFVLTAAGPGCATALNLQDATQRKPYGGVTMPLTEFFGGNDSGDMAEYGALFFWPLWACDKPLSLFADTLTLPYTLYVRRTTQTPAKNPPPPAAPVSP